MKLFPPNVYFYINSWTWGYEDILKAIAKAFQSKVRVCLALLYLSITHITARFMLIVTSIIFIKTLQTHICVLS